MPAPAILNAVATILSEAIPDLTVYQGEPTGINDSPFLYLLHADYGRDVAKATGQNIQRHHLIRLTLLVRVAADPEQAEQDFMAYGDTISGLFYTNHTLQQTAADCKLEPIPGGPAPYVQYQGALYRHRRWLLDAWEYITYGQG